MAKSRLIGDYPVIGIRPTIDGRRGPLKVRESLEVQTMNMAKNAAKLIQENVFYSNGEPVKGIIADTTIGRVIFNQAIPQDMGMQKRVTIDDMFKLEVDEVVGKKQLAKDIAGIKTGAQVRHNIVYK